VHALDTSLTQGSRWATWLSTRVAPYGADGRMPPVELARRLGTLPDGTPYATQSTVTRWLQGSRPDQHRAARVGEVLGDRAGALDAAGWPDPAVSAVDGHGLAQRDADDTLTVVVHVGDLDPAEREIVERHLQSAVDEVRALLGGERGTRP
jgi:hypothetical protein